MEKKKLVVITGCTRGLGKAMARGFVREGWTVAGCGRDAERLDQLRAELGVPHYFRKCDVATERDVASFAAEVSERLGTPDLLLNNAAIINPNNPLWEMGADEISSIVDINVKGPIAMMRHFLPEMLKRGSGVVVNFSSGWGRSVSAEVAPYCATKWAMEGLSQAVAQETSGKVAVVALNPGIIDTDMLRSTFGGSAGHYPDAERWAERAVPFLIKLGPKDNGRALTAPS
ncbi:MAG: SDR family oxidoreductase [Verrucomicrobiaceae bacterium]|nr:SDR family oxidoreductase [Verrucomicrobiaceae bacterium]